MIERRWILCYFGRGTASRYAEWPSGEPFKTRNVCETEPVGAQRFDQAPTLEFDQKRPEPLYTKREKIRHDPTI